MGQKWQTLGEQKNMPDIDKRTQELKTLASVVVDRLKWLMPRENYYSRNCNDHVTPASWRAIQPLCPRGSASLGDGIWAIVLQGEIIHDADKELLTNRWRTRKITARLQLSSN